MSPSSEYSGLISFRIDWFDHLAVQGTCQESSSAPQFESINSSALSLLYGSTLTSNSYMITGKTIALTIWAAVSKVIRLLFNMLSGFVIAFLPMSKHHINFLAAVTSTVILEPKKIKSATASILDEQI